MSEIKHMNQNTGLSDAVRSLRKALNESQQAFAHRMNTAVKTIARYETVRPPRGSSLANLARIARDTGQDALADLFERSMFEEPGLARADTIAGVPVKMNDPAKTNDPIRSSLSSLYLNRGDTWVVDQIREFLSLARHGAPIRDPLVIKGDRTGLDKEIQLGMWERNLVNSRLRMGHTTEEVRATFAREYAVDMNVSDDEATAYTRIRFPHLWLAEGPSVALWLAEGPSTRTGPNDRSESSK
jgi:transcriptional regulator with XRE-family HTH domain